MISNVAVYGLEESVVASGYPMRRAPAAPEEFEQLKTRAAAEPRPARLGSVPMGTGHDNFLNGIIVQFDLSFSCKAWIEMERYHFMDFVSSMSTMHRLASMDLDSVYNEYVDPVLVGRMKELQEEYNRNPCIENKLRLLYNNPAGMKLTARMTTNYRQLKTIHHQRKNHALPEWREFCRWCETLPHFKEYVLNAPTTRPAPA